MKITILYRAITIFLICLLNAGCSNNYQNKIANIDNDLRIMPGTNINQYASKSSLEEYLNRIGKRIIIVSDKPYSHIVFKVKNIDDQQVIHENDTIIISKGLLDSLDNEAELAAILSINIVHQTQIGLNSDFENDNTALKYLIRAGYNPQAYINLQEKYSSDDDIVLNKGIFPNQPTIENIKKNKESIKSYHQGLMLGKDRYLKQIKYHNKKTG